MSFTDRTFAAGAQVSTGAGHNRICKFGPEAATQYCKSATSRYLRRAWASIANEVLRRTGSLDAAIAAANGEIAAEVDIGGGHITKAESSMKGPPAIFTRLAEMPLAMRRRATGEASA